MSLKTQIQSSRNIKPASLNTYLSALHKIQKIITGEKTTLSNTLFLQDYDKIMKIIDGEDKITTKKNRLTAIIVALSSDKDKNDVLIKKFSDKLKKLGDEYVFFLRQQKKTPTQENNWIDYNDLIKIINQITNKIKLNKVYKSENNKLSNKDFDALQQLVIVRTYLTFPLRNDFANMPIIDENNLSKLKDKSNNYLVLLSDNKKQFHINQFKNQKSFGSKIFDIPTKLNKIINLWLKFNKSGYFLVISNKTNPMNPNNITKYLNKIFKQYANGKKISTSLLRHIIISHLLKDEKTIKEKEEFKNKFLHSENMNQLYRKI